MMAPPPPPPPPDAPPMSPRSDLLQAGLGEETIARYRAAFQRLDADGDGFISERDLIALDGSTTPEEAAWMLEQFVSQGAVLQGKLTRIDLSTFAKACEAKRSKEWTQAYEVARKRVVEGTGSEQEKAERLVEMLDSRTGVRVSVEEAVDMIRVANSQPSFFKALKVSVPRKEQAGSPKPPSLSIPSLGDRPASPMAAVFSQIESPQSGRGGRPASPMAAVFAQIESPKSNDRPASPMAGVLGAIKSRGDSQDDQNDEAPPPPVGPPPASEQTDLIFFDGTGDASTLPCAAPSLEETQYPPPTPPPLPES